MTSRLRAVALTCAMVASVLALACSKADPGDRMMRKADASLTIVATARTNGDVKPCG